MGCVSLDLWIPNLEPFLQQEFLLLPDQSLLWLSLVVTMTTSSFQTAKLNTLTSPALLLLVFDLALSLLSTLYANLLSPA